MILGISCGRVSRRVEFGAGSSDLRMASREASSNNRAMSVETEWRRKMRTTPAKSRNIIRLRRILRGEEEEEEEEEIEVASVSCGECLDQILLLQNGMCQHSL